MSLVRATRGASSRIARALRITTGAVAQWEHVPAEHVVAIERATGIAREKLRPDLYARDQPHAVSA